LSPSARRRRRAYDAVVERRCKGVRFGELCALLELHDWELIRTAGSHHIYTHPSYEGIVTLPRPHGGSDVRRTYCRQALAAISEVEGYD